MFDFIFRLGVVFAIYGFIWGIIELAIKMLSTGRKRSMGEVYLFRALKYFFLVDVTFLFCLDSSDSNVIVINQMIFAGLILLTYFIGKLQNNQQKKMLFQMAGAGLSPQKKVFSMKAESIIIVFALLIFGAFSIFPEFASNPMSNWFYESIINIEHTPIFGFVFKIIGFFFLLTLIFKMTNAISFILAGGKVPNQNNKGNQNSFMDSNSQSKDDEFDDFTEIT